jgi:hypothetical protein
MKLNFLDSYATACGVMFVVLMIDLAAIAWYFVSL